MALNNRNSSNRETSKILRRVARDEKRASRREKRKKRRRAQAQASGVSHR
jgi:hypothetical protein